MNSEQAAAQEHRAAQNRNTPPTHLEAATVARRATERDADAAREQQAKEIRIAVAEGRPVSEIIRVTGLTRARIYQIRDHRR